MIVAHIITSLDDGGAEAVLYRLCHVDSENSHIVICLQGEGKYGPLLESDGVTVYCLDMPRGSLTLRGVIKLYRLLRQIKPNAVQTWMYHADLVGGIVARFAGIHNILWGLHTTTLEVGKTKQITIIIARVNALLSRWIPRLIVSCSNKGVAVHQALGFDGNKLVVIPNGYDLSEFNPDIKGGAAIRSNLYISQDKPLLGMVARFDPQKDHRNLIEALGLLNKGGQDFLCILVGGEMTEDNHELIQWLDFFDVRDRVILLGQRSDIPMIMNALDVHVLSSLYGEAFPNVLCEAMACGTPCVTTDVGDASLIVGDTGWSVPAGDAELLSVSIADAIKKKYTDPEAWERLKLDVTRRIAENFSLEVMVARYNRVWDGTVRQVCSAEDN